MDSLQEGKKILMIFTDAHLSYSPTTLNLFFELKKKHRVKLIAPTIKNNNSQYQITDPDIHYLNFDKETNYFSHLLKRIYNKLFSVSKNKPTIEELRNSKTNFLISYLKKDSSDEVICIDPIALWCAQQAGKKPHLVSLELKDFDYMNQIIVDNIKSVIIQSDVRFEHLFKKDKPKYFLVQNSPKNIPFEPEYSKREKTSLLFCGSALLCFGIITCLDFIRDYDEYSLTIKGALPDETKYVVEEFYSDLINENRLIIDTEYLSEENLTHYVSKFRIGLAFYDFYRFSFIKSFNYYTAPSGKVFQYLNSGLPVVANNLPGFKFLELKKCGELIDYLSTKQIKASINKIEKDYLSYATNSKNESANNDFSLMITPFLDFIAQ